MEYQKKKKNLLGNTQNKPSKFRIRNLLEKRVIKIIKLNLKLQW